MSNNSGSAEPILKILLPIESHIILSSKEPIVEISSGLVRGLRSDDGTYNMFMGIPYGVIDKEDPFGFARPPPKFDGIFDANNDTAAPPQMEEFNNTIIGDLDCLHVNIYSPISREKLPVIVWIYGGRFEIGFGGRYLYGPSYFMKQEVVLVTINYRLGPYGFMCLDTPEAPGNQGLRDMVMALRWVKQNIGSFGGDANNITAAGHSAGSIAIECLMRLQERLFDKAILMSGSIYRPGVIQKPDKTQPIRIAAQLGFETNNSEEALKYLAKIDPKLVVKAHVDSGVRFRLSFEKKYDGIEQIIPEVPEDLGMPENKRIPVLVGHCSTESMLLFYKHTAEEIEREDVFYTHFGATLNVDMDKRKTLETIVKQFYVGDKKVSIDAKWDIINFYSDFHMVHPIQRSVRAYVSSGCDVYYYIFSYNGKRNFIKKKMNMTEGGTSHADDLAYLFDFSFEDTPTEEDQLTIDRMTFLWANFAKFSEPTAQNDSVLNGLKWRPATRDTMYCLCIDSEMELRRRPFCQRMAYWDLFNFFYNN